MSVHRQREAAATTVLRRKRGSEGARLTALRISSECAGRSHVQAQLCLKSTAATNAFRSHHRVRWQFRTARDHRYSASCAQRQLGAVVASEGVTVRRPCSLATKNAAWRSRPRLGDLVSRAFGRGVVPFLCVVARNEVVGVRESQRDDRLSADRGHGFGGDADVVTPLVEQARTAHGNSVGTGEQHRHPAGSVLGLQLRELVEIVTGLSAEVLGELEVVLS